MQSEIVWHLKSPHSSVLKLKTNATPSQLFHLYQFSPQSALSHDTLHVWARQWMPLQLISERFVTPWKPIRGLLTLKLHYVFSFLHIYSEKELIQHFSYKENINSFSPYHLITYHWTLNVMLLTSTHTQTHTIGAISPSLIPCNLKLLVRVPI